MAKKEKSTHICSGCIGEFDGKDLFEALVVSKIAASSNYYTIFCEKCIKKLGYENATPYQKTKIKSDVEKSTAKTKKSTTAKTKNTTTKSTIKKKK